MGTPCLLLILLKNVITGSFSIGIIKRTLLPWLRLIIVKKLNQENIYYRELELVRPPKVPSIYYWNYAIKKPNQMASRTLNFEAENGNWWGSPNHERKLLIGPEHTLHWIHWRISCSCVGKYGWKTVESRCNLVWFFDSVLWRELVVSLFSQNYEYTVM